PKEAFFTYGRRDVSNTHLSLWAPGRARHFFVPGARRGTTKDLGDIALGAGGSIEGRVLDESGAPVAGAEVVGSAPWTSGDLEEARVRGPERKSGRPTTFADEQGRFMLHGVGRGQALAWAGELA